LGISQPVTQSGNQLMILEDWMKQFIQLVKEAREDMRAKHETEIREKEALTAAIMDASLDAIVTVNQQGLIIDFNPTAEGVFGYPEEIVKGKFVTTLIINKKYREHFDALFASCSSTSDGICDARSEMVAINVNGDEIPMEVTIKPLVVTENKLFTIYLHDITERRQQEREIRSLAAFPGESPIPVMRVNRQGVIIYANDSSTPLLKYFGVTRMQVIPLNWRAHIELCLKNDTNFETEINTGDSIYSLILAPIPDLDYVNLYARDITETRAAEKEARRHQTELVHVCRLSSMGEMATGMAHELNQPLAAIINYANGARRRFVHGASAEELTEPLEKITSQAERAALIIKRLREMVERHVPVRTSVSLNDVVHEVLSFMDFEIRKSLIKIELDLDTTLPNVSIDLVQIEQVVLNLARNAVDALGEAQVSPAIIRIMTSRRGEMLIVTIEDNGPGIPEETSLRLFEPFYTTKQTGMGMGLSISETIMADHEGRITQEQSTIGGAAFTIWLPAENTQQKQIA
jgi:PAS domain S-box-containing protein